MCQEREHLAPLEHRRRPPERVPQRFYVAVCLFMSSIQDWLLGLKEKQTNNLNWSATCSYYSLVHGGRLLCFLAFDDYPTQHQELRQLLGGTLQESRRRSGGNDGYPFNWLSEFARITQEANRRHPVERPLGDIGKLREMLGAYLETMKVPDARRRLDKFGRVLDAAEPRRRTGRLTPVATRHFRLLCGNHLRTILLVFANVFRVAAFWKCQDEKAAQKTVH